MAHSQSKEGLVESFSIEPTTFEDFTEAPDSLCTRVLLTDDTSKIHYKIFIQVGLICKPDASRCYCITCSSNWFQDCVKELACLAPSTSSSNKWIRASVPKPASLHLNSSLQIWSTNLWGSSRWMYAGRLCFKPSSMAPTSKHHNTLYAFLKLESACRTRLASTRRAL